jgi:hypothetical protein
MTEIKFTLFTLKNPNVELANVAQKNNKTKDNNVIGLGLKSALRIASSAKPATAGRKSFRFATTRFNA